MHLRQRHGLSICARQRILAQLLVFEGDESLEAVQPQLVLLLRLADKV
jgi:hypothetical protein